VTTTSAKRSYSYRPERHTGRICTAGYIAPPLAFSVHYDVTSAHYINISAYFPCNVNRFNPFLNSPEKPVLLPIHFHTMCATGRRHTCHPAEICVTEYASQLGHIMHNNRLHTEQTTYWTIHIYTIIKNIKNTTPPYNLPTSNITHNT